jgi:hypothetical protein
LETYFTTEYKYQMLLRTPQFWEDAAKVPILTFLPNYLPNSFTNIYHICLKRQNLQCYPRSNRRHHKGDTLSVHHGYHYFRVGMVWQLFRETDVNLLESMRPLLKHLEALYKAIDFTTWCLVREKVPSGFGLFQTIFTTIVVNADTTTWHIDSEDLGHTALVYFGDFKGGELQLSKPISLQVPVQHGDIVFINSSKTYHRSIPFENTRICIGCYTTKIPRTCTMIREEDKYWGL